GAVDEDGDVERKEEDAVDAGDPGQGELASGQRGGRQEDAEPRIALPEAVDERPRGERLADRDRVNPDGGVAVDVDADRQPAHALGHAPYVLAVPQGLVEKPRRKRRGGTQDSQRVQRVHGYR